MNRTPEQQWSALSALYEEADGLPAHALAPWLARLEAERHPLLPQLKRMLDARDRVETDDFLGTLPKLSTDPPEASDWTAGRRVGPYRLVRPLGEGGMAEVWLAERDDGAFKRQVAIKLPYPRPGRETFALRFDRERDILATLRHPHIAGLFDAGVTKEGQAWLALEYVEGQPISTFCDERRLPLRERVQLFRQVLLAVQHAHANLVIHRDLKPANILVTPQGEVRLLDFGIAKLLEAQGDAIAETELTRQAGRSMTPRYASPEQLTGLPLTTACDVYSLGVVFYELMSGERPYELKVESPAQLEHAILEVEPRAMSRRTLNAAAAEARGTSVKGLRRLLALELDAIAVGCLAKKPSARYSSVDAVLADVDRWLGGEAVLARAPGAWYRFIKFANRNRLGVGLGVTAVASLVAVAAVAVVLGMQAREESARAVAARDFMLNLFKRADQEKSRGADITARELLETGRKDLVTRLQGQPSLQAELLQGIAKIQKDMGEYANADSTFAEAARIYETLGRPREIAMAHALHADNAVRMGDYRLAHSLMQQARSVPNLPKLDTELTVKLNEIDGWIAEGQGDFDRARTLFGDNETRATAAYGPHHITTLDALRGLIRAERQFHNYDAALALQTRLEAGALSSGSMDSKELAAMDWERADLLNAAGRYAEGLKHVQAALPRCDSSLGPNDESCRKLFFSKVRVLMRLGWTRQPNAEVARIQALAEDASVPSLQAEALMQWFRLELTAPPSDRQRELFERVRALGEGGADQHINPLLRAKALLTLAEARLLVGEHAAAEQWIAEALALQPRPGGLAHPTFLEAVGASLSGIALLQGGDPVGALERMGQGQDGLTAAFGARHALTSLFSINVALALEQLGRNEEALAVVARAESVLKQSYGEESPTYQRVQRLKVRLEGAVAVGSAARRPSGHLPIPNTHGSSSVVPEFFS